MLVPLFLAAVIGNGILDLNPSSEVLPTLLSARQAVVNGAPSVTLLQFSDLHGDCENLARVAEFKSAYKDYVDDAIHCGDCVICYFDNPYPWEEVPEAAGILNTIGNHDCWKGHKVWAESDRPYDALQGETYERYFIGDKSHKPFIKQWNVIQPDGVNDRKSPDYRACWYYKDYPATGLRLIVLDCIHYTEVQHNWFREILEDASKKGLLVVAVQHYVAQNGLIRIPSGFSSEIEPLNGVENHDNHQMERMPDAAFAAVDAFIEKGGKFVCWLSGHTHFDFLGYVAGHEKQMQVVVDKSGKWDGYMSEDRTVGTKNQDAFNLITVNPSKHFFAVQRVGCNRNEKMQSKKIFCYDYLTGEILVNE